MLSFLLKLFMRMLNLIITCKSMDSIEETSTNSHYLLPFNSPIILFWNQFQMEEWKSFQADILMQKYTQGSRGQEFKFHEMMNFPQIILLFDNTTLSWNFSFAIRYILSLVWVCILLFLLYARKKMFTNRLTSFKRFTLKMKQNKTKTPDYGCSMY